MQKWFRIFRYDELDVEVKKGRGRPNELEDDELKALTEPRNTGDCIKKCPAKSTLGNVTGKTGSKETQPLKSENKKSESKYSKEMVKITQTKEKKDIEFPNVEMAKTQETSLEEATKRQPIDVDLNDYVMKAAESNTVVHPRLVKKGGNIDDAPHVPTKMKLRAILDEAMKTRDDTEERDDKNAFKEGIKWGDAKCVVYETRDQLTLEDEAEEAADLI
uniref:Uncharacterized protein n=1 Tax=Angiostrongylus cantonensis TaxID=6313 RepID=A0A0K0DHE4_ANGCA